MKQKICIVTGTRAEYGLYRPLLTRIKNDKRYTLQIIATGTHFSSKHGNTYQEIISDGFKIDRKVVLQLKGNKPIDIAITSGKALAGIGKAIKELNPDLIILLGDRYEILAAATAAHLLSVPVAHMHGGELTEGSLDDSMRHAITKLSTLHFTSAEPYRKRVIQMGENRAHVFNTGATGVENCIHLKKKTKSILEKDLAIRLKNPLAVVTMHPATNESVSTTHQIAALLKALEKFPELQLVITYPNADAGNELIVKAIHHFAEKRDDVYIYKSLGVVNYLSLLKYADVVIGNSSSGIIEVPSFGIPVVNIGDRQKSRLAAKSVIHVVAEEKRIVQAIEKALSVSFRNSCKNVKNPYGDGNASRNIMQVLHKFKNFRTIEKKFHDIK